MNHRSSLTPALVPRTASVVGLPERELGVRLKGLGAAVEGGLG